MINRLKVPIDSLCYRCDEKEFSFVTTEEVAPLEGIIGQERAARALHFGLRVKGSGYNIYVAGPNGTGKSTYVFSEVTKLAAGQPSPGDWCYVYNFSHPSEPKMLFLPPGWGEKLSRDLAELIEDLKKEIPHVFNSEEFKEQQQLLINNFQKENSQMALELELLAKEAGLAVTQTPTGFSAIPVKEGKPLSQDEIASLPLEERQSIEEQTQRLQWRLMEALSRVKARSREVQKEMDNLKKRIALYAIDPYFRRLFARYERMPEVIEHFQRLMDDILDNLDLFKEPEEMQAAGSEGWDPYTKYKVNVLVDNCETCGAPVVVETNPNYYNLFGMLEYQDVKGRAVTDFTRIKPGALHKANGGYLILQAKDLLSHPLCWDALKRAIKNQEIRIENIGEHVKMVPISSLRPEPISLSVKVILIGSQEIYRLLYNFDEDFRKYFKVMVDFDSEMSLNRQHVDKYASFISSMVRKEGLKHFTAAAVARIVEYGVRLTGSRQKLSTRFNEVGEIIFEAVAWAEQEGSSLVEGKHVLKAIEEKKHRGSRVETKLQEMMLEEKILIKTQGAEVGRVNGLAVYRAGYYSFGKPTCITARVFAGDKGVINIEREAELSGPIHDKGVLILSGYLGGQYALNKPLALSASICFEQSYDGVDGDSASSAELYALLSALAEVPLKQELAVTGSVNQKGEIQPVGGINEKIEGFYQLCHSRGLTGSQGVIIPRQNVTDLMLPSQIVEAVKEGKFHIFAVSHVNEGMELLTGLTAGEALPDGSYPPGTLHYRIDCRLKEWADTILHK